MKKITSWDIYKGQLSGVGILQLFIYLFIRKFHRLQQSYKKIWDVEGARERTLDPNEATPR